MTRKVIRSKLVWLTIAVSLTVGMDSSGCDPSMGNMNGNGNNNGNNQNNNMTGGMPFGSITGTELLVEGERINEPSGDTRRRDERFTANYSLTPTSADTREIVINFDQFTTAIFGDISGTAHLTYEESGTEFSPDLQCQTTNYSGSVEWDVDVVGTYDYIPALGTIMLTTHATNASSTEYTVSFTVPGCPDQNSQNPSNYVWPGPGQGAWGFVDIVLENGHFEDRIENPFADDLGAEDFYEIELNLGS